MALNLWRTFVVGASLAMSAGYSALFLIYILAGAIYGGPGWKVSLLFNSVGEGTLELFFFPATLAFIALANYYFWKEN